MNATEYGFFVTGFWTPGFTALAVAVAFAFALMLTVLAANWHIGMPRVFRTAPVRHRAAPRKAAHRARVNPVRVAVRAVRGSRGTRAATA